MNGIKNIKVSEKFRDRLISGELSLVIGATGFTIGKIDSKINKDEMINETNKLVSDSLNSFSQEINKKMMKRLIKH